ncbi:hypothetical protein ACO2Q3_12875 [Caulobacter sp. KR2-114]|uniref:hypothetical protein n=1 Tax=Caulobacter sp. KR2-114 TaxID=3400912 RepID=UPI003BFDD544
MFRSTMLAAAALALAGCAAKAPPEDTCKAPDFTARAAPGTYAAEKETVTLCVRKAAFAIAKAGGDITHAGDQAVSQCKAEEAAVGKAGPDKFYDWQRQELHESLVHTGKITAAQARSLGCGAAPGAPKDTI